MALLLLIYLTSVVICSYASVVLPFVTTRISRSTRQPQGLMNDCSIERHVNPNPRFDLTWAPFYIGLQARLKIDTHLLSNRSPDGIRTLTVQPFILPFSWITDARDYIRHDLHAKICVVTIGSTSTPLHTSDNKSAFTCRCKKLCSVATRDINNISCYSVTAERGAEGVAAFFLSKKNTFL